MLHQAEALVAFFMYRPYMNGARNAPANAPQEMPISWAMKLTVVLYCMMAMTTEISMNTTISIRMMKTCFFSSMSLMMFPFRKSSVSVELEASTSEDSVDIDADRTRITTTPISSGDRVSSILGTMAS